MNIIRYYNIIKKIKYKRLFYTKSYINITQEDEEKTLQLEVNNFNIFDKYDEDNEDNNEIIRLSNISVIHSITNG
jgi:hypothetical protein